MVTMKKFNFSDGSMEEVDHAITDITSGPATSEKIFAKRWDDIVNAFNDGSGYTTFVEKENAVLGLIGLTSKLDNMTLAELKVFWKKRIRRQAREAFDEAFDIFDVVEGLTALVGASDPIDRTKAAYANLRKAKIDYKAARLTALNEIDAATTKEQVKAVSFVEPST